MRGDMIGGGGGGRYQTKIVYKNNVGDKVKDAIEENKKILKQMKKDSLRRQDE